MANTSSLSAPQKDFIKMAPTEKRRADRIKLIDPTLLDIAPKRKPNVPDFFYAIPEPQVVTYPDKESTSSSDDSEHEPEDAPIRAAIEPTAAHRAAKAGDIAAVEHLAKNLGSDAARVRYFSTPTAHYNEYPVLLALRYGHWNVFKTLVENGANPHCTNAMKDTIYDWPEERGVYTKDDLDAIVRYWDRVYGSRFDELCGNTPKGRAVDGLRIPDDGRKYY